MLQNPDIRLILASASRSRQTLLRQAGLEVESMPAHVDEAAVKAAAKADGWEPAELALALAELKARRISGKFPDALVIGADQLLVCNGKRFDKPKTLNEAAQHLHSLSGQTHTLITAACLLRTGTALWSHTEKPRLVMRPLTTAQIETYLAQEGDGICGCVGAYRVEGRGISLFDAIEGDHFSILGLPLLALLHALQEQSGL